ncbi:MAG: ATP-dependent Clp protease adaptor ClpS [Bacteroidetes bacterium]|nr:MAG: ATP-dependent Clp protease adaptor ClpS [Bacteroidota bacterium]
MFFNEVLIKEIEQVDEHTDVVEPVKLMVWNDNVNTFDWVITSLMEICGHTLEQAEQCAWIIHFKGKYVVKKGSKKKLKPMREALTDRGIDATLEE